MSRFPHGNDCGMVAGIASARSYTVRIRGSGGPGGRTIARTALLQIVSLGRPDPGGA